MNSEQNKAYLQVLLQLQSHLLDHKIGELQKVIKEYADLVEDRNCALPLITVSDQLEATKHEVIRLLAKVIKRVSSSN